MSTSNSRPPTPKSNPNSSRVFLGSWALGNRWSGIRLSVSRSSRDALFLLLLALVVRNRGLDRVLRKNGAVNLHRRQREFGHDVGVLDRQRLVDGLALQPFSSQAGAGNR